MLTNSKYTYLTGKNNVWTLLHSPMKKFVSKILCTTKWSDHAPEFKQLGISVEYVNLNFLNRLVNHQHHQHIVAQIQPILENQQWSKKHLQNPPKIIMMLDNIQDPQNFGAIIRSAVAFNIDTIMITAHNQVFITDTVCRASAGSIFLLKNLVVVNNLATTIVALKALHYWIYATTSSPTSKSVFKTNFNFPCVIIFGNEGEGVSSKLLTTADVGIHIPINSEINSLNVGVSFGIIASVLAQT